MNAPRPSISDFWRCMAALVGLVVALGTTPYAGRAAAWVEGALAPTDLLAPVDVQVTPLVGSDVIATRDGQLMPAVVRLDAGAADAAERAFNAAFARARVAFLESLEPAFGARRIDEAKIGSLRFQSFRSGFVASHPEFPVGYVLAAAWAQGDDGEVTRARLAGVLRQTMDRRLIGSLPRAGTVFVVALPADTLVRAWSEASPTLVRAVDRGDVVTLEVARAELWRNLGVGERFAGGYLETLVHETVRYDARLTGLFLRERMGAALEGRFWGRGEVIVRAGEPIDAVAIQAMRQIEELGLVPLVPAAAPVAAVVEPASLVTMPEPPPVLSAVASPVEPSRTVESVPSGARAAQLLPTGWMFAMGAPGLLSLVLGAWVFLKLRRLRGATVIARPASRDGDMREVLAREMTRQGMDALFTQRQELLKTTVVATERVAEMETRVAKVQPAIQEKMKSYERRIQALERELAEK